MSGKKGSFFNYSEDAMFSAIEDVARHGTSVRTAAKKFGVARTTLRSKLAGKSPIERKMGLAARPFLQQQKRKTYVFELRKCVRWGFPRNH